MKVAKNKTPQMETVQEKICDLYEGMSIWKVDLNSLREMDKNARVMSKTKFEQLSKNIGEDKRLESLPLATRSVSPAGIPEFTIISGHHRTRAARKALVMVIFVLVIEDLSEDEVKSKQLSHNSLNGDDDKQVLQEIYESIYDIDQKIKTGLTEQELAFDAKSVKVDDLSLSINFEIMQIAFFPHQKEDFDRMCEIILPDIDELHVAQFKDFTKLKKAMKKVSKTEDIRNISAILNKMVQIVNEHYKQKEAEEKARLESSEEK